MGGLSKPKPIVSQTLPSATVAPIPVVPQVATDVDAANVEAMNPNVTSLIGRDVNMLRKKQSVYAQYLGANRNNMPTLLGQ